LSQKHRDYPAVKQTTNDVFIIEFNAANVDPSKDEEPNSIIKGNCQKTNRVLWQDSQYHYHNE